MPRPRQRNGVGDTILCVSHDSAETSKRVFTIEVRKSGAVFEVDQCFLDDPSVGFSVWLKKDGIRRAIGGGVEVVDKGYDITGSEFWLFGLRAAHIMMDEYSNWHTREGLREKFWIGLLTGWAFIPIFLAMGVFEDWTHGVYLVGGIFIGSEWRNHKMKRAGINASAAIGRIGSSGPTWPSVPLDFPRD